MAATPTLHLRCALQTFNKLSPSSYLSRSCLSSQPQQQRHFLTTTTTTTTTSSSPLLLPQLPQNRSLIPKYTYRTLRFASDTSRHPASTHPSATSAAASNPASVPPSNSPSTPILTSSSPSPTIPQTPPPTTQPAPSTHLTWNAYLTLRRLRRRYSLLASLLTTFSTTTSGLLLVQKNMDPLGAWLNSLTGLDPILMLGVVTAGSGAVGWLLGPFVGEGVFRVVYRSGGVAGMMAEKEKDFYARIRRCRVDPSLASYSNPLPDYYGEKIGSVKDFRTWMRDQRAYNRKRMSV